MAGDVAAVPTEGKYEYLKSKLMEVYGLTDDQKADRLLDLSGLGDWKPSQLCAHIQSLTVRMSSCDGFFYASYLKMSVCK